MRPTPPVPRPTHAAVAYAAASPTQTLDLWLPDRGSPALPLVLFVHGGAFRGGDSSMVGPKVRPLLAAGFAVASLDYRLSGEARFPAAPRDVKAAVRFLRAHAGTYRLDPDAFAAWGESAGGNLVALLGVTGDQRTLLDDDTLGHPEVSGAVHAVVDWFGPIDFLLMDIHAAAGPCHRPQVHDGPDSPESLYLGAPIQTVPGRAAQADPITYVAGAAALPAFSIAHGTSDCLVPYQQSQLLADALRNAGADVDLTLLDGVGHAGPAFDGRLLEPTITWLAQLLCQAPPSRGRPRPGAR